MYIYQNDKLYVHVGDNKLVGVEIHPDKIIKIKGSETKLSDKYLKLTPREVQLKFNIINGDSYIFPVEKKVEVENEPVSTTKGTSGKSKRK